MHIFISVFMGLVFVVSMISCLIASISSLICFYVSKYKLSRKLSVIALICFSLFLFSYILTVITVNFASIILIFVLLFLIMLINILFKKYTSETIPIQTFFGIFKSVSYKHKFLIFIPIILIIVLRIYSPYTDNLNTKEKVNNTATSSTILKSDSTEFIIFAAEYDVNNNTLRIPGKTSPNAKVFVSEAGKKDKELLADEKGKFELKEQIPSNKLTYTFTDHSGQAKKTEVKTKQILADEEKYWKNKQEELKQASSAYNETTSTTSNSTTETSSYYSFDDSSILSESSVDIKSKDDITNIVSNPSIDQKIILRALAQQQFDSQYPYKGSKIHSVMGILKDWTKEDDHWFFGAEATIVNIYGAKESKTVEIRITPTGPDSGSVEIIDY